MKALRLCLVVFVALYVGGARGVRNLQQDDDFKGPLAGGEPLGTTDTSCEAFASLRLNIIGGRCSGRAQADCTAISDSQSVFVEEYKEWLLDDTDAVSEDKVCDAGLVEVAANATAKAVASVWTSALVQVDCDGQGFGCGFALSSGRAYAIAFAEAIAIAAADASQDGVEAFCLADIRALSSAFAKAADEARAETCTDEGDGEDFEDNYSEAVVDAIAKAFASATATACQNDTAKAESECFGEAKSTTDVTTQGDNAEGGQIPACEGNAATCCTEKFAKRKSCTCRMCNGPLIEVTGASATEKKTWRNRMRELCFCP